VNEKATVRETSVLGAVAVTAAGCDGGGGGCLVGVVVVVDVFAVRVGVGECCGSCPFFSSSVHVVESKLNNGVPDASAYEKSECESPERHMHRSSPSLTLTEDHFVQVT
jgi:hypothetical protein